MSLIKKIQYVFNKILLNFVKEIKDKDPDLKKTIKENYAVFDKTTDTHINLFISGIGDQTIFKQPYADTDILSSDVIIEFEILKNIKINDILKVVDSNEKEVIKCYLYTLYMLSNIYEKTIKLDSNEEGLIQMNELFTKCLKMIKKDKDTNYEEEIENIFDDEIIVIFKNIFQSRNNIDSSIINEDLDCPEEKGSPFDFLEGSMIGKLAKEITEDIEIDKLNISDPSELLNIESMFSGENNVLGDIISKVGNKVAAKINSGELNHEDLLGEAMSMIGKLNMGGGGANPFMEEMMKTAMNGKANPFMEEMMNGGGGNANPSLSKKSKNNKRIKK